MNKIKINVEKLFLAIFLVTLIIFSIYFVSPGPDIYVHYAVAKEILKDPSILWRANLTGWQSYVALQTSALTAYPPLAYFAFAGLMLVQLPLFLVAVLCIIAIGYFLYKIDGKAIPFLFLSFMFIRETAFNGYDIILVAVTFASFYFLMKKKLILSGIFAGTTPLIKISGLFVLLSWMLAMIVFERKNIKTKYFILAFVIALLLPFPWYFRNYLLFNDVYLAIMGVSREAYAKAMEHQATSFQMSQPEKWIWDSTGYYPLPIDLLFYIGVFFFVLNLIRTRKLQPYSIFIFIMVAAYFIFQFAGVTFFVIRHEMIILPFLALEIAMGIPEKYLKYAFVACLIMFIIFSSYLPKYAFNQYEAALQPAFKQIKSEIDNEPIYINAFHGWFVTYESGLNATTQSDSKWTLDFDQGQLYLTNKTNITGG